MEHYDDNGDGRNDDDGIQRPGEINLVYERKMKVFERSSVLNDPRHTSQLQSFPSSVHCLRCDKVFMYALLIQKRSDTIREYSYCATKLREIKFVPFGTAAPVYGRMGPLMTSIAPYNPFHLFQKTLSYRRTSN